MTRYTFSAPASRRYTLACLLFLGVTPALPLAACSSAGPIVASISSLACGALTAILGPGGAFWGTACSGLAQAIEAEIKADATPPVAAARLVPCTSSNLVPVPGFESVAMVCPGLEAAAARGAAKGLAAKAGKK